jgi:phosphoribosylanthranilate isomerase
MSRVFVKVCGITAPEDALAAAEAGVDAVGFVFYPESPRFIERERAAVIARVLPPMVLRVGLFVDATPDEMARTAEAVGLDILQLHGHEPPEALEGLPRRALKAVRVGSGFQPEDALRYEHASGILLDARLADETAPLGGTGTRFDWSLVRGLRDRVGFLMLAGGLDPDNVAEAIAAVRPHAVDVSSGVEQRQPGRKDPARVRAFVEAVRRAEGEVGTA